MAYHAAGSASTDDDVVIVNRQRRAVVRKAGAGSPHALEDVAAEASGTDGTTDLDGTYMD